MRLLPFRIRARSRNRRWCREAGKNRGTGSGRIACATERAEESRSYKTPQNCFRILEAEAVRAVDDKGDSCPVRRLYQVLHH